MKSKLALMLNPAAPGSRYRRHRDRASVTVLAQAAGYVMVRYSRCIPFVVSLKELEREFVRMPDPKEAES